MAIIVLYIEVNKNQKVHRIEAELSGRIFYFPTNLPLGIILTEQNES